MALICNVVVQDPAASGDWQATYARNEAFVEAGSAYFAKAFAEALELVADIELHDMERAQLRMASVRALLSNALDEYRTSLELDSDTGLGEHHRAVLAEAVESIGGFERLLLQAREGDLVGISKKQMRALSTALDQGGYATMMGMYLAEVEQLAATVDKASVVALSDIVAWQEFTWRITTIFTRAMGLGQAIAVLNIYTLRVASREADELGPRHTTAAGGSR